MNFNKTLLGAAVGLALGVGTSMVYATNGMNLEGYGPVSNGMGGTSFAFDNGTAAVMNNPATLGLMEVGTSRFDIAVGYLGPRIDTRGMEWRGLGVYEEEAADSEGTAYWMPAMGYITKTGAISYGVAVFAQGGMGTKYTADEWPAASSGKRVMSELGVGRLILPVAFNLDAISVGASLDLVWAGMDLRMAVPADQLGAMVTSADLPWQATLAGLGGCGADCNGRFDFENPSDMKGEAFGYGLAGKLGMVYRLSEMLSIGATYHTKSHMSDMETGEGKVHLSGGTNGQDPFFNDDGKVIIRNFQWPSVFGVGVAFQPVDSLMLAFDVKRLNWSEVMKDFKMTYVSPTFGNLNVALPQNWEDQTVFMLGAAFKATDQLTLRAGYNHGKNPVPNETVNVLFPATVEDHYTVGAGFAFDESNEVNFAATYAPDTETVGTGSANAGQQVAHGQVNWQLMYSLKF